MLFLLFLNVMLGLPVDGRRGWGRWRVQSREPALREPQPAPAPPLGAAQQARQLRGTLRSAWGELCSTAVFLRSGSRPVEAGSFQCAVFSVQFRGARGFTAMRRPHHNGPRGEGPPHPLAGPVPRPRPLRDPE